MLKVGIIGYGYWGPNILRNFEKNNDISVLIVCDLSEKRLRLINENHPNIKTTLLVEDIFTDNNIDLVAIITPVSTHFKLAKKALLSGKHVFVEKPFTSTSDQAKELINLGLKKKLTIMVDHTFLFTSAVQKIKELVESKIFGDMLYYDSVRVNLGLFQHDVNVIWDLAPHDISILNYIIGGLKPISVNAVGSKHFGRNLEDVAYLHVNFENKFIANFHVNWLSPVKIRQTMIGGSKKMMVWNDLDNDEKIKIYDKGVDIKTRKGVYDLLVSYRSGDMWSPQLENIEALKLETEHLVSCINSGKEPINSGIEGLKVVKILEASEQSIRQSGKEISLSDEL
jgi:predicted dehydrogenase